jgi:polyketide biosynthesis enoyl-CoA hydratase PksH
MRLLKRLVTLPRVIISVVDGRASAGGVGIVAASDFVFATERSQFSLPEALWGLLPCCVLPFLMRRVGFQKAYMMTLSTQPVTAEQARQFHLADEVSDQPELLVRKVAFRLSRLDPSTLRSLKSYFGKLWVLSEETERTALSELTRLMSSPVVQRNIANFVANRRFPWEA